MNVLFLTELADSTRFELCVADDSATCVLEGSLSACELTLREPNGGILFSTQTPAEGGLPTALTWLSDRNLRVDAVVHQHLMHGARGDVIRVEPVKLEIMRKFAACEALLTSVETVQQWRQECPQAVFLTEHQVGPVEVLRHVTAAGVLQPPPGCPKRARVRCDGCKSDTKQASLV